MTNLGEGSPSCRICGRFEAKITRNQTQCTVVCARCGTYGYTVVGDWLQPQSEEEVMRLCGWIREQNGGGNSPILDVDSARWAMARPRPRLLDRAHSALSVIVRNAPYLDQSFDPTASPEVYGVTYSSAPKEVITLVGILEEEGYLTVKRLGHTCMVWPTAKGLVTAEGASLGSSLVQGFVAMSFDPVMNDAWQRGFSTAIKDAGYEPLRIDMKEHVNGITDEIIAEIRQSRFVVADYTHQKSGVYFEAGFALGIGLTIIQTCRADEIAQFHFDIRHINTLIWQDPAGLARDLARRIRAVIGAGPGRIGPS